MKKEYTQYIDENGHCELPDGLKEIEDYAFSGRKNLTLIKIPNSVTSIGWNAFCGCTNLTSIKIPNSVTYIGNSAFFGCENLTSITIPNSVKSISDYAFNGCKNLTSITIFGKNENIDWVKSLMIPAMCKIKIIQEEAKPLTGLSKQIHDNAVKHGWWKKKVDFPTIIALCHAELSEALEEYRSGNPNFYFVSNGFKNEDINEIGEEKPEGVAVEMLDCVIRILDWCGQNGIDVDRLVALKNEYNKTRSYRHGGKVC